MDNIFGFNSSGIQAQYKQERFMEEARQYRLKSRTNFMNNNNKLQNIKVLSIRGSRQHRVFQGQSPKTILLAGKAIKI